MSLKSFHLAFIAISALLAAILAVYAYSDLVGPMRFVWSLTAALAAVGIVLYWIRFRKKMKSSPYQ